LSHRTSGWLHGWLEEPAIIEATVPRRIKLPTPSWLRLYRRYLPADVIGDAWGMPSVTREQALLDCVAVMPTPDAERLVDEQLARGLDLETLQLLAKKSRGRWGSPEFARQLRDASLSAASEPERLLARAFRSRGFDVAANVPVGPYICDFVDERAKLIIEVDGREFHSDPETFRRDRRRQNWLVRQGWMILRYAAYDVLADSLAVADEIIIDIRRRRKSRRLA
jgi:very-short-patch-repair endonuclease